jgi:phosphatidylglycerophosphate synthase
MLIGLTALGLANPLPVMLITARELVIASFRGSRNFGADQLAKWKTVVQIVAVLMLLLNLPLAGMVLWLAALLSLLSGGVYLWRPLTNQVK